MHGIPLQNEPSFPATPGYYGVVIGNHPLVVDGEAYICRAYDTTALVAILLGLYWMRKQAGVADGMWQTSSLAA